MAELTQAQLLELVNQARVGAGNPRVRKITERIVTDGKPVAGAIVDVWHANEKGRYSHFDPDQAPYNLRRRIETDAMADIAFAAPCHRDTPFRPIVPPRDCSSCSVATATGQPTFTLWCPVPTCVH